MNDAGILILVMQWEIKKGLESSSFQRLFLLQGDGAFTFSVRNKRNRLYYNLKCRLTLMNDMPHMQKSPSIPLLSLDQFRNKISMLCEGLSPEHSEGLVAPVSSTCDFKTLGNLCTRGQCYLLGGNAPFTYFAHVPIYLLISLPNS